MGNDFEPIRTFKVRSAVVNFLEETSNLDWVENDELQDRFVGEKCFVASNGFLLLVPLGKSEKLRRCAELFPNVAAFTDDEDPIVPFVPGFRDYVNNPNEIMKLAQDFLRLAGIAEGLGARELAIQIDRWIQSKWQAKEMFEIIKEDLMVCKVCAAIGETIRCHRASGSKWIVQHETEPLSGQTMFVADLVEPDGDILIVSFAIYGQLADPDRPDSQRNLAQSFLS